MTNKIDREDMLAADQEDECCPEFFYKDCGMLCG